jgi:hypothetical protein
MFKNIFRLAVLLFTTAYIERPSTTKGMSLKSSRLASAAGSAKSSCLE